MEKPFSIVVNRPFTTFVIEHAAEINESEAPVILFKTKVSKIGLANLE
jgi:hypothetical protein